jgi:thiopeptide-type bacteriocin biosynthesis protein
MREPLFIPAPFFFLRSPQWTMEDCDQILGHQDWINEIFNRYEVEGVFREAIAVASPSLHLALQKPNFQRTDSIGMSLLNYALRMSTRATPFGLFSFVATGSWGETTAISLDLSKVRKRARPDMSWVYALIQKLYADETSFLTLPVRTNPLIKEGEERFFLSYVRQLEKDDKKPAQTFSIRATSLAKTIFSLTKEPREIHLLCEDLLQSLPGLDRLKLQGVIRNLLSQQFLLPSFIPSLLSFSPFEDLLPLLPKSLALDAIVQKIEVYHQLSLGKGINALEELQRDMEALAPAKTFLQIDTVYEGSCLTLSQSVSEELTRAATALWEISSLRGLSPPLQAYHTKFIEKYGTHRTVPLIELLSEDKGLGSFENLQLLTPEKQVSNFAKQWEKWLYRKWQECLRDKSSEIVLNATTIEHLFALTDEPSHNPHEALLSMDLFCKIIADAPEQIDQGNFLILFVQPTWQGGNSIGRFVDLLSEQTQAQFREFIKAEESLEKDALFVEVSYWPVTGHNANVATHPCFRKYRLDIEAKKRDAHTLSLEDIYVGSAQDRFYLTLKDGGCEVLARVGNLLNPSFAPAPLQFMREVTLAKHQLLYPFSWGALQKNAVFLPRVRFERTILTPAQWNLDAKIFHQEQPETLSSKFIAWAAQWGLPRRCFLVRGDQQLLIDWEHPAHLQEIALKLKKGESLQFVENMGHPWIKSERGHHLCEIVVPFLKNPIYTQKKSITPPSHLSVAIEDRLKPLGSEWIYIKLYLGEEGVNRFLVQHLCAFVEDLCQETAIIDWFFIRYSDPERHLRLRMRLANLGSFSTTIFKLKEAVFQWMKKGLVKEMVLANYEREVERYGGPEVIEAAEFVFCADSRAIIHVLSSVTNKTLALPEPILHVLSMLNFLKGFGLERAGILALLNSGSEKGSELQGFRKHKAQLIKLAETEELEVFSEAARLRKESQEFFQTKAQGLSPNAQFMIYNSLLHMHCNRLGCDTSAEERARLYLRHTLMQLDHRAAVKKKEEALLN